MHKSGLHKLDKIDLKIISALQDEGRLTKLKLAEKVNISPTACWGRLQKLEQAGIIESYHASINFNKLINPTQVLVEITLKHHQMQDFQKFEAYVQTVPQIIDCYATGGGVDYILKFMTRNIDSYQRLIDDLLSADLGIERYFTYIITKTVKSTPQPHLSAILDEDIENL